MSASSSIQFGGRLYSQKWTATTIKNQRLTMQDTPASEIIRILTSLVYLRRSLYTEFADEIDQILTYCLTSQNANCTPWVRAIAGIIREGGNGGSRFGIAPSILDHQPDHSISGLDSTEQLVDSMLNRLLQDPEMKEALASEGTRKYQPHEAMYIDSTALAPALQFDTARAQANPHFSIRSSISFDIVIPNDKDTLASSLPIASPSIASSSSSSFTARSAAAAKPLPSSSLFASARPIPLAPKPLGPTPLAGLQKRSVQILDMNEATAAMDSKRRKTSTSTMVPVINTGISAEDQKRLKKEEQEKEKQAAKEAKLKEKEQKELEKKAAAEAKQKEKEEKAAAKLEAAKQKEAEKEHARLEKERLKEERAKEKEEREREKAEKRAVQAVATAKKAAGLPSDVVNIPPIQARTQPQLPPALMQALLTAPHDPNTMALFAQWQQSQAGGGGVSAGGLTTATPGIPQQQPFFFPPPTMAQPFQGSQFAYNPMSFSMPMMATTVATIPGSNSGAVATVPLHSATAGTSAAMGEFPPPLPTSAPIQHTNEFPPPPPVMMDTSESNAAAASLPALPPLPPLTAPLPPQAAAVPSAPQAAVVPAPSAAAVPAPHAANLDSIFAKSNKLTPEDREMIIKFLNHQDFPPPVGTLNGVYSIVLNEDFDVPDAKGVPAKETTIFEMTFATRSWRKLKKRKTSKKANHQTPNGAVPQLADLASAAAAGGVATTSANELALPTAVHLSDAATSAAGTAMQTD